MEQNIKHNIKQDIQKKQPIPEVKANIYEHKSLNKLILIFGIPSILSLMVEMMTGVVDTVFAGNLPGVGDSALAAMALLAPVLGIFTALQTLFAMSTGIVIARYLNNKVQQNRSYVTGVVMSLGVSTLTSLVCFGLLTQLLTALGATEQVFVLAKQYLGVQLISNIFSSMGYTLTCCIRAFGFPKAEVVIITAAVFINIVFNFIFAFVLKMGMVGLAWGTFVSEAVCALFAVLFLLKKGLWLEKTKISAKEFIHSTGELFKIGISQTVVMLLGGCTGFFVNARLLSLGTISHVAAWSIIQRLYSLILMPIVGLTQGVQSIIAYFSGNGMQKKTKRIAELTMAYSSVYGIVALVAMFMWGENLLYIFGESQEIFKIAKTILFVVFAGLPFVGILYTNMTLLQVTEHEVASVVLILSRQVFLLLPLIYLIPWLFGQVDLGMTSVMSLFLAMPVADVLAMLFSLAVKKKIAA